MAETPTPKPDPSRGAALEALRETLQRYVGAPLDHEGANLVLDVAMSYATARVREAVASERTIAREAVLRDLAREHPLTRPGDANTFHVPGAVHAAVLTRRPELVSMLRRQVAVGEPLSRDHVIGVLAQLEDAIEVNGELHTQLTEAERKLEALAENLAGVQRAMGLVQDAVTGARLTASRSGARAERLVSDRDAEVDRG